MPLYDFGCKDMTKKLHTQAKYKKHLYFLTITNNNSLLMKFLGIIPARWASSRFPGKPLAQLGDMTMIQRVYTQAKKALDDVVVATDDDRIFRHVQEFGGTVVMTSTNHRSGTDRCAEAYQLAGINADVVINIQGDEPFIQVGQIEAIKSCFPTDIATLVQPFTPQQSIDELINPNSPKVVFSQSTHQALMFSRSVIPYTRGVPMQQWLETTQYYKHIGMYAYTVDTLMAITKLPPSPLELTESLEQLRWLENGYQIKVAISEASTIGIDTPDDLQKALLYLNSLEHKS